MMVTLNFGQTCSQTDRIVIHRKLPGTSGSSRRLTISSDFFLRHFLRLFRWFRAISKLSGEFGKLQSIPVKSCQFWSSQSFWILWKVVKAVIFFVCFSWMMYFRAFQMISEDSESFGWLRLTLVNSGQLWSNSVKLELPRYLGGHRG